MTATSKKSAKNAPVSATTSATATPATASVHPVPTNVSAPPAGWVEPEKLGRKGRRPRNGLTLAAPTLADELRQNGAALAKELGPKAPDPTQLASALDTAYSWAKAEDEAATFQTYVRSERGTSWDAALALMGGMKLGVRFALQRDPTFADRFPRRRESVRRNATPEGVRPRRNRPHRNLPQPRPRPRPRLRPKR